MLQMDTGKHICISNTLLAYVRSQGDIALGCASSSGIAENLLIGGAHYCTARFKVINLTILIITLCALCL